MSPTLSPAFLLGRRAYFCGQMSHENPYVAGTKDFKDWLQGHRSASDNPKPARSY